VAWFKDLGGLPFDARVRAVVDGHRKTFESLLGCIVEEAEPDFGPAEKSFPILRAWNSAHTHAKRLRDNPDAFKDTLKGEIEDGMRLTAEELGKAEAARGDLWRTFQAFLGKYEYFVLPTTQLPPFDVATEYPTEIAGVRLTSYIDWMKSCWYLSLTGNPAASVPGGFTSDGLPVGVQIVGRSKEDFSVLQIAHAFENATGYGKKRPPNT
jgi:amidase